MQLLPASRIAPPLSTPSSCHRCRRSLPLLCADSCREEGNACYYLAKFETVDCVKSAVKFSTLDWLSFLEALGHVCRFKELPRSHDLAADGFASGGAAELMADLDDKGLTWNACVFKNSLHTSTREARRK